MSRAPIVYSKVLGWRVVPIHDVSAGDCRLVMQRIVRAFGGVYEFTYSLGEADAVLIPLVGPRQVVP